MDKLSNPHHLAPEQYQNSDNLRACITLFERFSTNEEDFARWMFAHIGASTSARVLELGSGPANLWLKNRERIPPTWHVTLTDLSQGMVEEARDNVRSLPEIFELQVADAQALPFPTASFDVVIANHMLFHVPDIPRALAEARRVLKPSGRFYATTNGKEHLRELHAFVHEYLLMPLEPGCKAPTSAARFRLEDAPGRLAPYFHEVQVHAYPNHLEVTEVDTLLASVLSWESWRHLSNPVSQERLEQVIQEARDVLEHNLARGPFYVTQSSGLLIAS